MFGPADSLVTGEAVALDLHPAQLPSRFVARTFDLAVQIALLIGLTLLVGEVGNLDGALAAGVTISIVVAVLIGYPVAFETLTRGKSLGKMAMGLRVVREDGGSIRFRQTLVRALFDIPEVWLSSGTVAFVVSLGSPRGRRVGDYAAGTLVIRERVPKLKQAAPAYVDPRISAWAASVDVSRVPDPLALSLRSFLIRSPSLSAPARAALGTRFWSDLWPFLVPPPPTGAPPEMVMQAVLSERTARERQRATSHAAAAQAQRSAAPDWQGSPPTAAVRHLPPTTPVSPPATGGFTLPS